MAIRRLADDLVAGGEIEQHGGARERLLRAGWDRHPQVLTDLDADHEVLDRGRRIEEQVDAEGDILSEQRNVAAAGDRGRREPANLVELLVIRNVRLRYDAEHA